jgi:hypothetical protein
LSWSARERSKAVQGGVPSSLLSPHTPPPLPRVLPHARAALWPRAPPPRGAPARPPAPTQPPRRCGTYRHTKKGKKHEIQPKRHNKGTTNKTWNQQNVWRETTEKPKLGAAPPRPTSRPSTVGARAVRDEWVRTGGLVRCSCSVVVGCTRGLLGSEAGAHVGQPQSDGGGVGSGVERSLGGGGLGGLGGRVLLALPQL